MKLAWLYREYSESAIEISFTGPESWWYWVQLIVYAEVIE